MSLTELALIGWSAAFASSAFYAVAALARRTSIRTKSRVAGDRFPQISPSVFRLGPGAVILVAIYAFNSEQILGFRVAVFLAAALRGAWFTQVARLICDVPRAEGVRNALLGVLADAATIFLITSPELLVLGGSQHARLVASDFLAAAFFLTGLSFAVLRPRWTRDPIPLGCAAMLVSSYALAWREGSGFLTLFAPLFGWSNAKVFFLQDAQQPISEKTHLYADSSQLRGETSK